MGILFQCCAADGTGMPMGLSVGNPRRIGGVGNRGAFRGGTAAARTGFGRSAGCLRKAMSNFGEDEEGEVCDFLGSFGICEGFIASFAEIIGFASIRCAGRSFFLNRYKRMGMVFDRGEDIAALCTALGCGFGGSAAGNMGDECRVCGAVSVYTAMRMAGVIRIV